MRSDIEYDREDDGRWIADIPSVPGLMAYGHSRSEATRNVLDLLLRVIDDRLVHGEEAPEIADFFADAVAAGVEIGPMALARLTRTGLDPQSI